MKHTIISLLLLFTLIQSSGQTIDSLNQDASPEIGLNNVAIKYFGIEFNDHIRKSLEQVEIELIYTIDEEGNPTLSEVNGVTNPVIIDSLISKTKDIGQFYPRVIDGVPESSIYFLKLTYPVYPGYQSSTGILQRQKYKKARLEDFEYINESGHRCDMTIGGMVNQYIGKPTEHLAFGGGMKIDIGFSGKNKLIYGLNMGVYGNKLKKDYPISSPREQFEVPPTLLIGAVFGKWFDKFNVQLEVNAAVQNITEKLSEDDKDWVQLTGWSPGVVVNYPIQIGKSNLNYYYGEPSFAVNNINLHFGLRFIKLSLKEATGLMTELGVSYRLTYKGVDEYKLKDGFFDQ